MKKLKRTAHPRFYYHITSSKTWGEKIKLFPKINGRNRDDDEPKVSRICVGPDLVKCFIAIPYDIWKNYFIYRTYKKVYAYHPYGVVDSQLTREKWLITPTTFIQVGEVPEEVMGDFPIGNCMEPEEQEENLPMIEKVLILEGYID